MLQTPSPIPAWSTGCPARTDMSYTPLHLAWHWLCCLSISRPSSALRWVSGSTPQYPSWEWGIKCAHMCKHTQILRNTEMRKQVTRQICVHTPRFAQLLYQIPPPCRHTSPQSPIPEAPICCAGTQDQSGGGCVCWSCCISCAVKAAASDRGHPALPRGVAATTSVPKCFVSPLRPHTL